MLELFQADHYWLNTREGPYATGFSGSELKPSSWIIQSQSDKFSIFKSYTYILIHQSSNTQMFSHNVCKLMGFKYVNYNNVLMQKEKVDFPISYEAYAENSKRRIKMRKCNMQQHDNDFFGGQKKIAQIKVIQKFIGKLRVEPKNYEAILSELDTLNMTKYIEEVSSIIASSVHEKEIPFYTEIATKLNADYEEVPSIMIKDLTKCFNQVFEAQDDPKNRIKSIFIFTVELFVCGFSFSYKEVLQMLKKVFKSGKSKKASHPSEIETKLFIYWFSSNIFSPFIAHFAENFTKKTPIWISQWKQKGLEIFKLQEVLPAKAKQQLTFFFTKYVKECFNLLKQIGDKISEYEKQLFESLRKQGQFSKQTQRNYNQIIQKFIGTKKNLIEICMGINEQLSMEQLDINIASVQQIMAKYINKSDNAQIFQDQFQKEIYQNIPDLVNNQDKNAGEQAYKQFKPKLDNCKNVVDCNQLCKSFCPINSKKNRKFLMKDCLQYRKEYHLVTPYLCRLIAVVNINYKDIGDWVNEIIFSEYERIKDSPVSNFVINDKKSRFLKYICQFTKFKVVDPEKTMNCIEYLIDNLNGYNIELIVSVLQNVGRFLYLSQNSANRFTFLMNKYQNVIKKKSFPIFTTSQLINSINLLKPRKEEQPVVSQEKTQVELLAEKTMSRCIIDEIDDIVADIDKLMKTKQGFQALKVNFLKTIERYDFLNSYNYAFLLDDLHYDQLSNFVVDRTIQNLSLCLVSRENQKTILWGKFLAQLYKYKLLQRSLLYLTIENLFKITNNQVGVINVICKMLDACVGYLDSKKVNKNNERFMLFVKFKKYISKCAYVPMLEQFQILQVFQQFQPDLAELSIQNLDEFLSIVDNKMKNQGKELNYARQLDKFLSQRNLKKKQEKKVTKKDSREEKDTRKQESSQKDKSRGEVTNQELMQEMKSFDKEFNNIMQTTRKDYSSRIAKKVNIEKVFDKKKEKKKDGSCITIIGRSGNKFIRKEVTKKEGNKQ